MSYNKAEYGKWWAENNRERKNALQRDYVKRNLEKIRQQSKTYYIKHKDAMDEASRKRYANNREKYKAAVIRRSIYIKAAVFQHYGGRCNACGESRLGCLELDHINNDGARHRKQSKRRSNDTIYLDLLNSNFKTDFSLQILCASCHQLRHCSFPNETCNSVLAKEKVSAA